MDMPKPSAAHQQLAKIVGNWKGEERLHPSPWEPNGGTATGRVKNAQALDGFVVVQDYEQERGGAVTFRGHGVFSHNPAAQCYDLYWWDSMGMPPNLFKGNFENGVLTMTCKDQQGVHRVVFDFSKENQYAFRMEGSPDGKQFFPFMEGKYARA